VAAAQFHSLVGQEHVVRALTHALGASGCITPICLPEREALARRPRPNPGQVAQLRNRCHGDAVRHLFGLPGDRCRALSLTLLEVDAATNTRVDEMRQLLENAVYAPTTRAASRST
jgi:DNA polymerase-3 subunit gamma/tau